MARTAAKKPSIKKNVNALATTAKAAKDRALADKKRKCDELIALIERRQTRILEDFYDIGEALRTILRDKLYEAHGAKSFADFLDTRDLIPRTTAMRLIAIVDHVPRTQALRLGQEKSYALIAYTEATPEPDTPAALAKTDAKVGKKPLSKTSVREVIEATKTTRRTHQKKKPQTPAQRAQAQRERTALDKLRTHLKNAGIPRPKLEPTKTGIRADLSFTDIDKLRP